MKFELWTRGRGRRQELAFDIWRSQREFDAGSYSSRSVIDERQAEEDGVWNASATTGKESFSIKGYCDVCCRRSRFRVDLADGGAVGPGRANVSPNWRETLVCERCGLNNRMRAGVGLLRELGPAGTQRIWIQEQTTPLYQLLWQRYNQVSGSEFVDDSLTSGLVTASGIRHEDVTGSSFLDGSLDYVLSFDVLEHVPDYGLAIADAARVLSSGGLFLWSAPFRRKSTKTTVMAEVLADGSVRHLVDAPEYHVDPMNPGNGILCYQHFGWEILDDMRARGFTDAYVVGVWSKSHANLGSNVFFVVGIK